MLELITLKYKKKFAMQYKSLFLLMAISALTSNAYADNKFMRINLLSDTSKIYNIGSIKACYVNNSCITTSLNKEINLGIKQNGDANYIGDIPLASNNQLKSLEFIPTNSHFPSNVNGRISLDIPLKIDPLLNYQALVNLKTLSSNLQPSSITVSPFRSEFQNVFYVPEKDLNIKLKSGINLNIPANALNKPQIFVVSENNVGEKIPLIDIYPYLKLNKNLTLTLPQETVGSRSTFASPGYSSQIISNTTSTFRESSIKIATRAATAQSCQQIISSNINAWIQQLRGTANGLLRISQCENIPPYMHIVLVDNTRTKVIVAAEKYSANSPNNQVKLLPITDYIGVPRVKSGINGFVWDGDSGSSRGQQGTLIGNVVSGGRVLSTAAPGKNYYNFHFFNNNTTNWQLTQGPYNFPANLQTAVGSSTSIVKNGACSGQGNTDRWSAIGSNNNYVTAMMSSTSGSEVNDKDLCPIFQSLTMNNAIRLDGGPSAAIFWDNLHLNPLVGASKFYYGTARSVAYPLLSYK